MAKLAALLSEAKRLRDLGTQSLYTNDASMHLAESTLDLVIELIEAIADVMGRADENAPETAGNDCDRIAELENGEITPGER